MGKAQIRFLKMDDGTVAMEMHVDGEPKAHMFLDEVTVATLIDDLAKAREMMPEPVAPSLDPAARLMAIIDPAWHVSPHEQGQVLGLRHPGLGWIGFLLPQAEATAMSGYLSRPLGSGDGPTESA